MLKNLIGDIKSNKISKQWYRKKIIKIGRKIINFSLKEWPNVIEIKEKRNTRRISIKQR